VTGERPMWAEKGGIDFDGREKWDHWKECESMDSEEAKLEFVRAYYEFSAKDVFQDNRFD
jgi:acyl-CoA-binding protein